LPTSTILAAVLLLAAAACDKQDTATPEPKPAPPQPVDPGPKADPIPAGWFSLTPQLAVPDVAAAVDYYTTAFGAQKVIQMPGPDGKPLHAEVKIGDSLVMIDLANDEGLPSPEKLGGTPVTLMLYVEDVDAAFKAAAAAGGDVEMEVADMFWGDRFGQLTDPFGHRWAVASHLEDLTDEQIQTRGELMAADAKKKRKRKTPSWKQVVGTPSESKIPKDYHSITMSLVLSDSAAAIDFYKAAFGAVERSRMPTGDGKIMHAEVTIGDTVLMMADEFPEQGGQSAKTLGGSPVMIHHYVEDVVGVHKKAVGAGGTSAMEVSEMFWGDRYGAIVDPTMIPWGLATHVEDLSPEEMDKRMKAQFAAEAQAK
jgi:uncharacterized glyoxalase superfamily protein PhnB